MTNSDSDPQRTAADASRSVTGDSETIGPVPPSSPAETVGFQVNSADSAMRQESIDATVVHDTSATAGLGFGGGAAGAAGSTLRQSSAILRTGVGDYELLGELGCGGMGVVYRARHRQLGRDVALKMILAGAHAGSEQISRFLAEAQAVAHLQHPNIVQIFDIGRQNDLPYFSLEFVDGPSLSQQIREKPLPPVEAARLTETLARAMQYAHEHNVLHRDLKPANILMTLDGCPKISDFGLAKRLEDDDSGSTRTGTIMGTPSYMSPEQARGDIKELGPASDQYSLGAILYELLTGRPPLNAAKAVETVLQVINSEPVAPSQLQPKLPADIETICLKALQKDRSRRYASCREFAEDLRRFQAGEPIEARPIGRAERTVRWCRRNPRTAALLGTTALLLLLTAAVSTGSAIVVARKNDALESAQGRIKLEAENARKQELIAKREAENAKAQEAIANREAENARKQEEIAVQKAKDEQLAKDAALASKQVAEGQANLALSSLQTMISEVQRMPSDVPGTVAIRTALLDAALKGLDKVAEYNDKSTSKEASMAAVYQQMGKLYQQLNNSEKAYEMFVKCHGIVTERVKIQKGADHSRFNLAASHISMAELSQDLKRDMEACVDHYQQAKAGLEEILARSIPGPDGTVKERLTVRLTLAEVEVRLGATYLRMGNPRSAADYFQRAMAQREELLATLKGDPDFVKLKPEQQSGLQEGIQQDVARASLAVGNAYMRLNRIKEVEPSYRRALEIREAAYMANRQNLRNKQEYGRTCGLLGEFLLRSDRRDESRAMFDLAVPIAEELVAANKENAELKRDLGIALYRLGCWHRRYDAANAASVFERCNAVREALAKGNLANDRRQMEWMLAQAQLGQLDVVQQICDRLLSGAKIDNELLVDCARARAQCAAQSADAIVRQQQAGLAVELLSRALENGYSDAVYLQLEVDFDPLRAVPEFVALTQRLQDNLLGGSCRVGRGTPSLVGWVEVLRGPPTDRSRHES